MAKLPTLSNISPESFKDLKWMPRLLAPLNAFMAAVVAALNKQLTIEDNMAARLIETTLEGSLPMRIAWSLKSRPSHVLVGQVARVDGVSFTAGSTIGIQWSFNQEGQLQIDAVTGITPSASDKYILSLICFTG